jgi:hypothetical protein
MATAEELLAGMSTVDDTTLVIDNYLRQIKIPKRITNLGVEHDDDVLTLNFKMPRYLDDIDLSKFAIRINYINANGDSDAYTVDDSKKIVTTDHIRFSWLVGPTATAYKGVTTFIVCMTTMKTVDDKLVIDKEYNTTTASLPVLEGLEVDESVVTQYSDIIEQWKRELFDGADAKIQEIWNASQDAAEAGVSMITDKEKQVLQDLDENYPGYSEVAAYAQEGIRTKADAIESTAEGTAISVSDSSDDHIRGLRVFGKTTQMSTTGKNRLQHTMSPGDYIVQGVTFTVNDDGSVECNGTATNPATLSFVDYYLTEDIVVSGCPAGGDVHKYRITADIYKNNTYVQSVFDVGSGVTISAEVADYIRTNVFVYPGVTVSNLVVHPMIRLATSNNDAYEPYSGGVASPSPDWPQELVNIENPTAVILGKNFWPVGHIVLNGNSVVEPIFEGYLPLPATLSWTQDFAMTVGSAMFSYIIDGKTYYTSTKSTAGRFVLVINKTGVLEKVTLLNWAPETGNLTDIQLELGTKATEYEPYRGSQSLDIPRTLPGIPVTSDGNYTDENGQQWVCDEIDFERGVYIQRINRAALTGDETYGLLADSGGEMFVTLPANAMYTNSAVTCMCNYYPAVARQDTYNNGMTPGFIGLAVSHGHARITDNVRFNGDYNALQAWVTQKAYEGSPLIIDYVLATPIETPLTTAELEAFKALYTNRPNTTVFNDSGAHMELKYNVDTKTYLDNSIKQSITNVMEAIVNGSY